MAATSATIQRVRISDISPTRKIGTGVIEILVAIFIFFVFAKILARISMTTFVMTPGGITIGQMGDWVLPSQLTLWILCRSEPGDWPFPTDQGFRKVDQPDDWAGLSLLHLQLSHLAGCG